MKIALLIAAIIAIWIVFISLQIVNSLPRPRPAAVVVPHCFSLDVGMFLPCAEVDRYEYT